MDMEHIREFTVLAEVGSLTEISHRLSISQLVLLKHIKMLELDLGVQLFERNKRLMELSEYGKLLLLYAQQIVRIQNEVADAFSSRHHAIAGTLTIRALPIASYYGLGDVISDFTQGNPYVSINMIEGDYHGLIEMLTQQKCDSASVREAGEPQNHLARIPFAMDKLTAALPEGHPLAKEEVISLQLLKEEPFIFSSEETYSYQFCMKACKEAGFNPSIVYTSNNGKNLLDMVRRGVGITLVSKRPADVRKGKGIVSVNLTPEVRTQASIYYSRSMNLPIAASHFLIYVNRHGEGHSTGEKEKGWQDMELDYLREFITAVEVYNSFETSEQLFIFQSTPSRHIRSTEESLDVALLDRTPRSMNLNHYGKIFLNYTKEIVRLEDECHRVLGAEQKEADDTIHVSTINGSSEYLISEVFPHFKNHYPEYQMDVYEADSTFNMEKLRKGECNFAFVVEADRENTEFGYIVLTSDELVAVLLADHRLAVGREPTRMGQLSGESLLLFEKNGFLYNLCIEECEKAGFSPRVVFTSYRSETIMNMVKKTMGIALMLKKEVQGYLADDIVIVKIVPEIKVDMNLRYRGELMSRYVSRCFIECVKNIEQKG